MAAGMVKLWLRIRSKVFAVALCWSVETARLAKEHNNANVLSIGQRQISQELTLQIIDAWLNAEFEEAGTFAGLRCSTKTFNQIYPNPFHERR